MLDAQAERLEHKIDTTKDEILEAVAKVADAVRQVRSFYVQIKRNRKSYGLPDTVWSRVTKPFGPKPIRYKFSCECSVTFQASFHCPRMLSLGVVSTTSGADFEDLYLVCLQSARYMSTYSLWISFQRSCVFFSCNERPINFWRLLFQVLMLWLFCSLGSKYSQSCLTIFRAYLLFFLISYSKKVTRCLWAPRAETYAEFGPEVGNMFNTLGIQCNNRHTPFSYFSRKSLLMQSTNFEEFKWISLVGDTANEIWKKSDVIEIKELYSCLCCTHANWHNVQLF